MLETNESTEIIKLNASEIRFIHKSSFGFPCEEAQLEVLPQPAEALYNAAALLKQDQIVAFPTETVYGLGGLATSSDAVSKIFEAKRRPADNPLITHFSSLTQLRQYLDNGIPTIYQDLIRKYWPGPLSILLPLPHSSTLSPLVTAGNSTFAARMPSSQVALALIHLSGPLAAPSANSSTRPSPTTSQHVFHDLHGRIPLIIDGGPCHVGVESTVIDGLSTPPIILRPGGISKEQIQRCPGWENVVVHNPGEGLLQGVPRTPGMKYRHYSPNATVVLCASSAASPSLQGRDAPVGVMRTISWNPINGTIDRHLGNTGDEISQSLFATLRELDELGCKTIFVEGISEIDAGLAIMNRLRKAATEVIS